MSWLLCFIFLSWQTCELYRKIYFDASILLKDYDAPKQSVLQTEN